MNLLKLAIYKIVGALIGLARKAFHDKQGKIDWHCRVFSEPDFFWSLQHGLQLSCRIQPWAYVV